MPSTIGSQSQTRKMMSLLLLLLISDIAVAGRVPKGNGIGIGNGNGSTNSGRSSSNRTNRNSSSRLNSLNNSLNRHNRKSHNSIRNSISNSTFTRPQHFTTIVGGFSGPYSSMCRPRLTTHNSNTHTTNTRIRQAISMEIGASRYLHRGNGESHSSSSSSHLDRSVPNTDPYCLNTHHYHNSIAINERRNRYSDYNDNNDSQNYRTTQRTASTSIHRRQKLPLITPSSRLVPRGSKLPKTTTTTLSSSITANHNHHHVRNANFPFHSLATSVQNKMSLAMSKIDVQDVAICFTYILTMAAITIPVILIPMIAADPFSPSSTLSSLNSNYGANAVGNIVSLSMIGAGVGKCINGFVCQAYGSSLSGSLYLLSMAGFAMLLSATSTAHAGAIAGMEFCSSIMWTACSVLISNRYSHTPKKFASVMTALSLCSTAGTLMAKTFGSALLSKYHWRTVAQFSAVLSTLSAAVMYFVVNDVHPARARSVRTMFRSSRSAGASGSSSSGNGITKKVSLGSIQTSLSKVLSNRMFWLVGVAHACSALARGSDRILGSFINHATNLPIHICGSLTSSVTFGFVCGLITGRKMEMLQTLGEKKRFIRNRYRQAVLSCLAIAACANKNVISALGGKVIAAAITLFSGMLASSISFQFYQFPPKFATFFGDDKAICISFIDAVGFLLSSPVWRMVSRLVASTSLLGSHGWSVAWMMLAGLFIVGGNLTLNTMPTVLQMEDSRE